MPSNRDLVTGLTPRGVGRPWKTIALAESTRWLVGDCVVIKTPAAALFFQRFAWEAGLTQVYFGYVIVEC